MQLTGALADLKVLSPADLPRYKQAVVDGEQTGLAYYFPYLLTYNRSERSAALLEEVKGVICIYLWKAGNETTGPRLDLLIAPTPLNSSVLQRCLDRANQFNGDQSARILMLDAKDVTKMNAEAGLKLKERKPQYLYSPQSFSDISGRKYRTMRRNIAKVTSLDNVSVFSYEERYREPCLKLLRKWRRHHHETHGTRGGVSTSKRIIELAGQFGPPDIHGEVIMISDELVGFAFGGEIRPGVAAFLEAKCAFDIQGLSYFQRYSFMSRLAQFDVINDGSDVGREGLRQLKNSLRPIGMHAVYRGFQR